MRRSLVVREIGVGSIKPNTKYHAVRALLTGASVRAGQFDDARHAAATVLLVSVVPERDIEQPIARAQQAITRPAARRRTPAHSAP